MALVPVSNSLQITWSASSFCSWCTMSLKPSRACGTRWLKGAAGCPPFLVPGWWPPPFEELVVHASQSTSSPGFGPPTHTPTLVQNFSNPVSCRAQSSPNHTALHADSSAARRPVGSHSCRPDVPPWRRLSRWSGGSVVVALWCRPAVSGAATACPRLA